jgi:tetratricopeptide (TPR) repeat protein
MCEFEMKLFANNDYNPFNVKLKYNTIALLTVFCALANIEATIAPSHGFQSAPSKTNSTKSPALYAESGDRDRKADSNNTVCVKYNPKLKAIEYCSKKDKTLADANAAYDEGMRLYKQGSQESIQTGIRRLAESAALYAEIGSRDNEATSLINICAIYLEINEYQKALEFCFKVLPIAKALGDQKNEGNVFNNIGSAYLQLGDRQKALEYYTQALSLRKAVGDREGEATTLTNIGLTYSNLNQYPKALEYYTQALPILRELKDRSEEALTRFRIGFAHKGQGDTPKALDNFNQALKLYQAIGDRKGEAKTLDYLNKLYIALKDRAGQALTLYQLGTVSIALGNNQKALDYFSKALPLAKVAGDRTREAKILSNRSLLYIRLGDNQKALDSSLQAVSLWKSIGDRTAEVKVLTNIGGIYLARKEPQKSLNTFSQALALSKAIGDRKAEAKLLTGFGLTYKTLGQKQKALHYFLQTVSIRQFGDDRATEVELLATVGDLYNDLGKKQRALDYYAKALPIRKTLGDAKGQIATLRTMAKLSDELGNTQTAIDYSVQALKLSKESERPTSGTNSLNRPGDIQSLFVGNTKALEAYNRALVLAEESSAKSRQQAIAQFQEAAQLFAADGDRKNQAIALNRLGGLYVTLGEQKKALETYNQALSLARAIGDRMGEAANLNNLGTAYKAFGDYRAALDVYVRALPLIQDAKDRAAEAIILTNMGAIYNGFGERQKALDVYTQALPPIRSVGDRTGEARILNGMGLVYNAQGENQKALDTYNQALSLSKAANDLEVEAIVLSSIGGVYQDLGEPQKATSYYSKALLLSRAVGDRASETASLNNLGSVYLELGDYQKALDYFAQTLPMVKALGARDEESSALNNMGTAYSYLGRKREALQYFLEALALGKTTGVRTGEVSTLSNIGETYFNLGEPDKALDYYDRALALSQAVRDYSGEVIVLGNTAGLYRAQGKLEQSLQKINAAIEIIEDLRAKVNSQDLRTSYFSSQQKYYQFKIDLLMQLHPKAPQKGYDKQALETADRSRARGLIELLTEAGVTLQSTTEKSPVMTQERQLQQSLRQLEQQRVVLLSGTHTPAQVTEIDRESDAIATQLQNLTDQLRRSNPAYANLKYPQPLTTEQIQQQILDKDTVLLQYSLGDTQSYLWVVTADGINSYILPSRADLEAKVKPFQSAISTSGNAVSDAKRTGDDLFQLILAPAAKRLQNKRLLIVADGILQYIPFAALPLPDQSTYIPLLKEYEVINAPSASSVAALRQQPFSEGTKTVAVLADPVFKADDSRVTGKPSSMLDQCAPAPHSTQRNSGPTQTLPLDLQRNLRDLDLQSIQRLPNTRIEAEKILALVPPNQRSAACAFTANTDRVTQSQQDPLDQYRIVHFATHGFMNNERPQLSGLVLSLVDPNGKPRDGFLRLRDIYNLKLAADLVVLSACQTGLGKDIRGEGMVGLTRGFMYAGSKRVVTSLWSVEDAATAQLMGHFYSGMLKEKQTPAVALRNAQLQMWKTNPDPRLWAAFTLQGEWRP